MKKPPKLLYVLPNLFTVSSIGCGLYAILQATDPNSPAGFYRAAIAILFGVLFDAADGRVARMTKTQSDFGVQLDSLADMVTFGVAPAILVYRWALEPFDLLGAGLAFVFAICGALRLARFNIMSSDESGPAAHFLGLPIPMAATAVASLVLLCHREEELARVFQPLMLLIVPGLAALMVSHVHYRTFKKVRATPQAMVIMLTLAALVLFAAWRTSFSLIFVVLSFAFILLGLAEETVKLIARPRVLALEEEEEEEEEEQAL